MNKTTHRVIDRTVAVLTPADGGTPFRPAGDAASPEDFFALANQAPAVKVKVEEARRIGLGQRKVLRKRFAFASPARSGIVRNDTVRGYWYSPLRGDVRASLIFLHAWKTATIRSMQRLAEVAVGLGCEVYLPAHPYHAWRRPKLTYSGITFLSPDLDRSLKAMQQAVLDARTLINWVEQRGHGPLILAGVDLGGLVAALTATVHPGLDALSIIATHSHLSDMLWEGRTDRGKFREALDRAGVAKDEVDRAWSVLDPSWRAPLLDLDKVLLVAGRYDDVCRPEGMERLAARWGGGRLSWHNFAHASFMFSAGAILEETLALVGLGKAAPRDEA